MKPPPFRSITRSEDLSAAKPGDTIQVGKLPVTFVTSEEAEASEFVVCTGIAVPLIRPDNQTGPCRDCGDLLQWRPVAPHPAQAVRGLLPGPSIARHDQDATR